MPSLRGQLVVSEFRSNSLFQKALKDAFEVFVNKEVASKHSNAEMVCLFCDRLLKSGGYVEGTAPAYTHTHAHTRTHMHTHAHTRAPAWHL